MNDQKVFVLKKVAPFLISILIHFLFLVSLFLFKPIESANLRIEVQIQQTGGSKVYQQIPTMNYKEEAAVSPSIEVDSTGILNGSQIGSRNAKTTVLGSDIGIHASYPRLSRVMGEKGTVQINIENGSVSVSESSGFPRLDESALSATRGALKSGLLAENLRKGDLQVRFIFRFVE